MISDDPRVRSYIAPARVSWPAPAPPAPPGAERLLTESIGQPSVWRPAVCALSAGVADHRDAPMLFCDFGRELHGGIQLVIRNTTANRPVRLRITFGESIAEALAEPNQDHAIHQSITEVPWAGIHEVGCTGFRFVRIELVDPGTFVELQGLRAVTLMRPEPVLGTFECNDARINDIWATAVHTLRLCMQDYLWDGAKRDRLVWAGDLHPEVMAVLATFGGHPIVPASLDYLRDDAPLPQWMNGMPTYSMWWLITLRDWHLHTGDASTLKRARGYLVALVRQVAQLVDADGRDHLPARFLDWASQKSPDAVAVGSRALLKLALQAGGELCRTLGDVATAAHADDAADRLAGVEQPVIHNQQANALCALAGLADAERTNAQCFAPSPMRGLSPFYGYYVLEARALAGDHAGALNLLRTYWGGMLDLGATSFWEHFDADWLGDHPTRIDEWPIPGRRDVHRDYGEYCYQGFRHSLCHAWSSGPAPWLARHILGVTPSTPGFRSTRIDPHLGDLKWARGSVPTPHGPIHVIHERLSDGSIESQIDLPDGIRRDIRRPASAVVAAV